MTAPSASSSAPSRTLLGFVWFAIAAWGFALGAKVFDLIVVGSSWALDPPRSLARMPYGRDYPVDPGDER